MVICQGCGQSFAVPAGYGRNKIQCPGCGVICPVPADATRGGAARGGEARPRKAPATADPFAEPPGEEFAARVLDEPTPAPLFDGEEAPVPAVARPAAPVRPGREPDLRIPCRRCGRLIRRQRECPSCDPDAAPPAEAEPPRPSPGAARSLELDDLPATAEGGAGDDDEDDTPYLLADKDVPLCPRCRKATAVGAVVCTACGFDTRTRKKVKRTYEPIARSWETDMPLARRLLWFGVGQAIHLTLSVFSLVGGGGVWPFLIAWPLLTGLLAFVLGTFDRVEITRDARGRAQVTTTWRFAFVPLAPVTIEPRGFEGVTTGTWHDAGFWEWLVFGSLIVAGVVPAIVWWYNAIHKPHFHVALALDHGHAEAYVYRGRSEEQMNEIADVLVNASGLRRLA